MPTNKKTNVTENYPWLVYSQDIDAIDDGGIQPATADTLGGVKIGEGISVTSDGTISAEGGTHSGTYLCSFWNVDSNGTNATDGDYATARAFLADGKPIACNLWNYNLDPTAPSFTIDQMLKTLLTEDSIKLYYSTTEGLEWDANGITPFIDQ